MEDFLNCCGAAAFRAGRFAFAQTFRPAVRRIRDQPQDRLQMAGPLSGWRSWRVARSFAPSAALRASKAGALTPQLAARFAERASDPATRAAAARALIALDSQKHLAAIGAALASADEPDALREKLATYLAEVRTPPACSPAARTPRACAGCSQNSRPPAPRPTSSSPRVARTFSPATAPPATRSAARAAASARSSKASADAARTACSKTSSIPAATWTAPSA